MRSFRGHQAFTLIELLVVVGILTLLAALAVPHFLEAQTRAKVSAAKGQLRTLACALEAYHVDHGAFPTMRPRPPDDPFGLLADKQLEPLTTPVAYVGPGAMRDPFGVIRQRAWTFSGRAAASSPADTELPVPSVVNAQRSLLYYEYKSFSVFMEIPALWREGVAILSIGPDSRDSFGVYAPFPEALPPAARSQGFLTGADCLYDATNGSVSEGDLPRYAGEVTFSLQP